MKDLSGKEAIEAFSSGEETVVRTVTPVSSFKSIEWLSCKGYVICAEDEFRYLLEQAKEFSMLTD